RFDATKQAGRCQLSTPPDRPVFGGRPRRVVLLYEEKQLMAKKRSIVKPLPRPRPRPSAPCCAAGVCDPERTQGLRAPAPQGTHPLVTLTGPGVFLGASVSKQGGVNDITFVILDIDGRNVANLSFAAAANLGLTQQNPFGLV